MLFACMYQHILFCGKVSATFPQNARIDNGEITFEKRFLFSSKNNKKNE